ncbi:hypothetical protein LGM29_10990 [Klebsiella quasipneumoniae subsp. similipneumoniae]|nr:hypothetical protein LGM29_10990 [Klebsiella quasipneumoniae subsp. similipneumoniae]
MFAGKKSAQIREILISESAWEEMTCLFAPSLSYIDQDEYGKEFLSKDKSYSFTIYENERLSDVDGHLNRRYYHEHFAHIFTLLVEKIIN